MEHGLPTLQEHLSSFPVFTGVHVVHVVQFRVFTFSFRCCDVRYEFCVANDIRFIFTPFVLQEVHVFSMLFVIIYVLWCPIRFLCHIMFEQRVPLVKRKRFTMPEALRSPSVFMGFVWINLSLCCCVVFSRSLFVFVWHLYCLSFNLRLPK